jgi:hypothetical protein
MYCHAHDKPSELKAVASYRFAYAYLGLAGSFFNDCALAVFPIKEGNSRSSRADDLFSADFPQKWYPEPPSAIVSSVYPDL